MSRALKIYCILTRRCTLACKHCSACSHPGRVEQVEASAVVGLLEGAAGHPGSRSLVVGGGEPTLHPDLRQILAASLDLGYQTMAVTNAHWVDPDDPSATAERLRALFPRGVTVSTSLDPYHLEQDPDLIRRVQCLQRLAAHRNPVEVDGSYNGPGERAAIKELTRHVGHIHPIPVRAMGRARAMEVHGEVDPNRVRCPRGVPFGFVISEAGVFYCLRGAMNNVAGTLMVDDHDPELLARRLDATSREAIDDRLDRHYRDTPDARYAHACDICEAAGGILPA